MMLDRHRPRTGHHTTGCHRYGCDCRSGGASSEKLQKWISQFRVADRVTPRGIKPRTGSELALARTPRYAGIAAYNRVALAPCRCWAAVGAQQRPVRCLATVAAPERSSLRASPRPAPNVWAAAKAHLVRLVRPASRVRVLPPPAWGPFLARRRRPRGGATGLRACRTACRSVPLVCWQRGRRVDSRDRSHGCRSAHSRLEAKRAISQTASSSTTFAYDARGVFVRPEWSESGASGLLVRRVWAVPGPEATNH